MDPFRMRVRDPSVLPNVCQYSKLFVDELGGGYGVGSGFDGVVCGQVVVFARVKDDAAVSR